MENPKIIQINSSGNMLYGLDSNGGLWWLVGDNWAKVNNGIDKK